jgi:hypothetical protein
MTTNVGAVERQAGALGFAGRASQPSESDSPTRGPCVRCSARVRRALARDHRLPPARQGRSRQGGRPRARQLPGGSRSGAASRCRDAPGARRPGRRGARSEERRPRPAPGPADRVESPVADAIIEGRAGRGSAVRIERHGRTVVTRVKDPATLASARRRPSRPPAPRGPAEPAGDGARSRGRRSDGRRPRHRQAGRETSHQVVAEVSRRLGGSRPGTPARSIRGDRRPRGAGRRGDQDRRSL